MGLGRAAPLPGRLRHGRRWRDARLAVRRRDQGILGPDRCGSFSSRMGRPCGLRAPLVPRLPSIARSRPVTNASEPLEQAVEVFQLLAGQGAVAGATADFVEYVARLLTLHLVGNLHRVAIAAFTVVEPAENVA